MKLKIKIDGDSYSESDQETAIDISHTSFNSTIYEVTTMSGLQFNIVMEETSVRYSYDEPNFDVLEKTGKIVYERNSSNDEAKESAYSYIQYAPPIKLIFLDKEELKEYFENYASKTYTEQDNYSGSARKRIKDFHEQQVYGVEPQEERLECSWEDALKFSSNIENALGRRLDGDIDIEVPKKILDLILSMEDINFKVNSHNNRKLDNMELAAYASVEKHIGNLVEDALVEMKLNRIKNKM